MAKTKPRVSIGVPVYNSKSAPLREAIQSLLTQEFDDFEIILADNASDEPSQLHYREIAASDARVRYIRHEQNRGAWYNFNFVLEQAEAPYFMWAADDDVRGAAFLSKAVRVLDENADAGSVMCRTALIDQSGARTGSMAPNDASADRRASTRLIASLNPSAVMDIYGLHRTEALRAAARIDLGHGAELLLVMRILLRARVFRIDEELFYYRTHPRYSPSERSQHMYAGTRPVGAKPFSWWEMSVALLRAIAREPLDLRTRTECLTRLAAAFYWQGWFGNDHIDTVSTALKAALREHRYLSVLKWSVPYAALAPRNVFGIERVASVLRSLSNPT